MERRREQILAAALRVFARGGYAAATLKDIAAAAGLNSAAQLYYYFPKKEDLLGAVLVRYLTIDQVLDDADLEDPPPVAIERFLTRYLAQMRDAERMLAYHLVGIEGARLLTMGLDLSAADLPRVHRELRAYLRAQVAAGGVREIDPDLVAGAIIGIANFHIQNRATGLVAPVEADETVIRHAIDLVLHGIEPR